MISKVIEKEKEFSVVGKSLPRKDAIDKVTGTARYAADYYFPGMLYAKTLRTKYPRARIKKIDVSKALEYPGVVTVITAKDVPFLKNFGFFHRDIPPLVKEGDITNCIADGLAVVAAISEEIAEKALELIEVEYEPLPGIYDPLEALKDEAKEILGENRIYDHLHTEKGDVEKGFAEADLIIEREYRTQRIEHSYLEPEAVVVVPEGDRLIIYASAQYPNLVRGDIATALNMPQNKIHLIQATLGGGFGGKHEAVVLAGVRAALVALKTGRPVKMEYSREESMIESSKRHPYILKYKIGVKKDGTIVALDVKNIADGGAYCASSPWVLFRSHVHATGAYEIPNVRIDSVVVKTNNPNSSAMRGFGNPQVFFAIESLIDEVAEKLGMSPIEIRMKNALKQGSVIATGQVLNNHTVSIRDVLKKVVEMSDFERKWKEYKNQKNQRFKRGIGVAITFRGVSFGGEGFDFAGVYVTVFPDGTISMYGGVSENGQGLRTALSQIAAEEFGVPYDYVIYSNDDTFVTPYSLTTSASRGTFIGGWAVKNAVSQIKERMKKVASEILKVPEEKIIFRDGYVFSKDDPENKITFKELVQACYARQINMSAVGWHYVTGIDWDPHTGKGNAYITYAYSANVAEVEVDTQTGNVKVLKIYAVHDSGTIVNPVAAKSQVYGGISWSLGYALLEDFKVENGYPKAINFDKYRIARAMDMPEVEIEFIENPDPNGPFGAKSIGEPALEPGASAIANAISHAIGVRFYRLPITRDKVLEALKKKKEQGDN